MNLVVEFLSIEHFSRRLVSHRAEPADVASEMEIRIEVRAVG